MIPLPVDPAKHSFSQAQLPILQVPPGLGGRIGTLLLDLLSAGKCLCHRSLQLRHLRQSAAQPVGLLRIGEGLLDPPGIEVAPPALDQAPDQSAEQVLPPTVTPQVRLAGQFVGLVESPVNQGNFGLSDPQNQHRDRLQI
jgi:hypothetical protein